MPTGHPGYRTGHRRTSATAAGADVELLRANSSSAFDFRSSFPCEDSVSQTPDRKYVSLYRLNTSVDGSGFFPASVRFISIIADALHARHLINSTLRTVSG